MSVALHGAESGGFGGITAALFERVTQHPRISPPRCCADVVRANAGGLRGVTRAGTRALTCLMAITAAFDRGGAAQPRA